MIRESNLNDLSLINKYLQELGQEGLKQLPIDNPFTHIFVYEEKYQIVGFIQYSIMYERSEIEFLYIETNERRKGIASKLLKQMEQHCIQQNCTNITLEVRESNVAAQFLYQKQGYQKISIRKKYYGNESAIVMEKVIK